MNTPIDPAYAHYRAPGLTQAIREALLNIAPEKARLRVADLAALDQFHTRGILATNDLAALSAVRAATRVLDVGCGLGGPARFLADQFGCQVTGVDLSEGYLDAAQYLTHRCGLEDRVSFRVGNALDLPFEAGAFDVVFLQHVAMNIRDRPGLYAEIRRVLASGGRLATYDVLVKGDAVRYPMPWAREAAASFLLTEYETRSALLAAGLRPTVWRDDSALAMHWFDTLTANAPPGGVSLALVLGPELPALVGNLRRNLGEGRIGILSAVLEAC